MRIKNKIRDKIRDKIRKKSFGPDSTNKFFMFESLAFILLMFACAITLVYILFRLVMMVVKSATDFVPT